MEREKKEALRGRRSVDEIDLLPQMLREPSLADREIVLPYQRAKDALELLGEPMGPGFDGKDG
jgi:hypothetical protein